MKYYVEDRLRNFIFVGEAKSNANMLTCKQLDVVEEILEEAEPDEGWSETAINDMFWFDFDTICRWLGYENREELEGEYKNKMEEER